MVSTLAEPSPTGTTMALPHPKTQAKPKPADRYSGSTWSCGEAKPKASTPAPV